MDIVSFELVDPKKMYESLVASGLEQNIVRRRSAIDPQTIILALGGGVGIAAIVQSIGSAIKSYFEGHARSVQAEKETIKIHTEGLSLECTAANVDAALGRLLEHEKARNTAR
jgi:hypothetical protein